MTTIDRIAALLADALIAGDMPITDALDLTPETVDRVTGRRLAELLGEDDR